MKKKGSMQGATAMVRSWGGEKNAITFGDFRQRLRELGLNAAIVGDSELQELFGRLDTDKKGRL